MAGAQLLQTDTRRAGRRRPRAGCRSAPARRASPEASAEPALKPNQPNHRIPAPIIVNGSECGATASRGQPWRRPITKASASAEAPELISTTLPPAKSSTPLLGEPAGRREHPVRDRRVDDDHPQHGEDQEAAELRALGGRAGQQRGGDDGEHHLERGEGQRRHRSGRNPGPVARAWAKPARCRLPNRP